MPLVGLTQTILCRRILFAVFLPKGVGGNKTGNMGKIDHFERKFFLKWVWSVCVPSHFRSLL